MAIAVSDRHADEVDQVVAGPTRIGDEVGMNQDRGTGFVRGRQEGSPLLVCDVATRHVGAQSDTDQTELFPGAAQLADGQVGVLQRDRRQADQAIRMSLDQSRCGVVEMAVQLQRRLRMVPVPVRERRR